MADQPPGPHTAGPVFLSYAWEDAALADQVERQLRVRGVPVWRDRRGMRWGAYNEAVVLEALERGCCGFVLLLTDAAMRSEFILQIELPAMARRRAEDSSFFAGALFARDVSIASAADELFAACGVELRSQLGTRVEQTDRRADVRQASCDVLRSYLRQALPRGAVPVARIETRDEVPEDDPAVLHVAWSPPLAHDLKDVAQGVWAGEIQPALADLRRALEAVGAARSLVVEGRTHLSAALALGHEFRAPTGWTLLLRQGGLSVDTALTRADLGAWRIVTESPTPGTDDRLVFCLHASADITASVKKHRKGLPPARVALNMRSPGEPSRLSVSEDDVNALCAAIGDALAATRTRYGVEETDLYLACPPVMAAALGWHLSSRGPLLSYEADVERSSYYAACRLV
jgi:hypothetical protein